MFVKLSAVFNTESCKGYGVDHVTRWPHLNSLLTISTASRMSRSGQSRIVTRVVSSEPSKRVCMMAVLSPGKLGPWCKKEWPIIRPAMVNMSPSSSSRETEGIW